MPMPWLAASRIEEKLTALALSGITAGVEAIAVGDVVSFTGAISMASASDRVQITPVVLEKAAP